MFEIIFISFVISFCEIIGQTYLRGFVDALSNGEILHNYFLICVMYYVCLCALLFVSYDHGTLGEVNALWSSVSVIVILLVSYFVWGEDITFTDFLGSLSVFIGIMILVS